MDWFDLFCMAYAICGNVVMWFVLVLGRDAIRDEIRVIHNESNWPVFQTIGFCVTFLFVVFLFWWAVLAFWVGCWYYDRRRP